MLSFNFSNQTWSSEIKDRYHESHRRYHNWGHICDMLLCSRDTCWSSVPLDTAILFHDAVYEPGSTTNEADSAYLARQHLLASCVPEPVIREVESLIAITKTHEDPSTMNEARMIDLDLYSHAATPEVYLYNSQQIIAEYLTNFPYDILIKGRIKFLEEMLDREQLFFAFKNHKELTGKAHSNMENERKKLTHELII